MNLSEVFAQRIIGINAAALRAAEIDQISRLLLDFAGVACGCTARPWVVRLRRWANRYDGAGRAGIIGGRARVPAPIAALVNGTTAHSYELDDTHDASLSHPGAVVIPAALAVASETGAGGAEFMMAMLAGYEAMAIIGMAVNTEAAMLDGFHPTAIIGGFGSAAAAAKLYGLDVSGLLQAWGHVLSMTGGSMQFSDETTGTTIKRMHAGYPAKNGVLAAELSAAGIDAPKRPLDGKYGFLALYGREARPELLAEEKRRFAIHDISLKPYACCREFHSMIDGLRETTENFTVAPSAIQAITVRGPKCLQEQHMLRRPDSPMAAQYSLPFVAGATLEFGPTRFDAFESANLDDKGILRWADMVEFEYDESLQANFPAHFGTEVEIRLAGGQLRTARVLDSIGTAARPLSWEQILEKANRLTGGLDPALDIARLERAIRGLPTQRSIDDLDVVLMMK
ncbi:MAG: MmgE/PrpD family protein [Betaproteobacteria bacterium]|nr:MmgE/PrpD family protein [Betaproteobacteria bacterium]